MNCPSRTDADYPEGWNQSPRDLNADATTRADFEHVASARMRRDHRSDGTDAIDFVAGMAELASKGDRGSPPTSKELQGLRHGRIAPSQQDPTGTLSCHVVTTSNDWRAKGQRCVNKTCLTVRKYLKFIGPGFMVSVAYIDPGNYATDVAAGASFRFQLLFIVLMSNIFAILLQSLCIKLGTVTGMNLAENCKAHLPRWLNYILYFLGESAIIATDIAEVIGTAIALNLLLHIPLVAGCAISIVDVMIILLFYQPSGTMRAMRVFEFLVMLLVIAVVVCFCFELSKIDTSAAEVLRGYLPSSTLVKSEALYQACGILGATVMPHSLYLGSGIVQPRLRHFDEGNTTAGANDTESPVNPEKYRPSLAAIRSCMSYSIAELAISLFTFALFVNSAILIVAGASLYGLPGADNADLFSIHSLLSKSIAPVAGTLFALALLLSGLSAGLICTIAGQMVSEGHISWTMKPWLRRLFTRSISITPSIIIAGAVGREGLGNALQGSQVALSVLLPFVSAPLIWFTCRKQYMKVPIGNDGVRAGEGHVDGLVQFKNGWVLTIFSVVIWLVIVVMNVALLVLVGLGVA